MALFLSENTANMTNNQEAKFHNYFNYLSDDVLLDIFERCSRADLESLRKVCKRFQRVSRHPKLGKKIFLTQSQFAGTRLEDELIPHGDIAEVDLSGSTVDVSTFTSDYWRDKGDGKFISLHIETLNLSNVRFKYAPLDATLGQVKDEFVDVFKDEVEILNYQHGFFFMLNKFKPKKLIVENVSLRKMFIIFASHNCFQLDAISLEYMKPVKLEAIYKPFFCVGNKLKEINLSNSELDAPQLLSLCCLPITTEKLMLNNVNLTQQYLKIFRIIPAFTPDLKYLGVSLEYLKNPEVLVLLKNLEHLETLRLYHSEWESLAEDRLEFFPSVLTKLPHLKNIHFVTEQGDDLSQLQEDEIKMQVAKLRNHINTNLIGIFDTRADIYDCEWELHFIVNPWFLKPGFTFHLQ